MAIDGKWPQDLVEALYLAGQLAWRRTIRAWVYIPVGVLCVLLACWGADSLIGLSPVSFPASVALLIVLFFALILSESLLGDKKTKAIVRVIDIPAGFALRYINVFFLPSFVLLPLSPSVSGVEIGKITGVFLIGFVIMLATTAYFTRGLQLLLGSSKRAVVERAEEMGAENDDIPLTHHSQSPPTPEAESIANSTMSLTIDEPIAIPTRTQDPSQVRITGGPPQISSTINPSSPPPQPQQDLLPPTRPQRWAAFITLHLDSLTYVTLLLFIGLPLYYTTPYTFTAHLPLSILSYYVACILPPPYSRIIHPVLLSSALTILAIQLLALSHSSTLHLQLLTYTTKTRYTQAFSGHLNPPSGAGDILSSLLDVSIIALALPMYNYRSELRRHFTAIVVPNIALATASLFGYPALCHALGITPGRSLAFASRSLTLALATPATRNLGGDEQAVAVLCIMSGVMGVLVGPSLLKWMKIPGDDYVTRGVAMGGNASAIATALLLVSDPRAAALSSLSMTLFGTVMVAMTSVPVVAEAVKGLVGLG